MNKRLRFGSLLLALTLLLGLAAPAAQAADQTKATTLRLEKKEGDVTLTNARGKTLTGSTGSKLYSGYTVTTGAAGYAWISLDDDVVVKADEHSVVTVKQSGKKLEVLLESGNLFFNVSKPLEEDASLDIRTSSMSTGIRGTSGMVSVTNRTAPAASGDTESVYVASSRLVVFEGTVLLTYNAPAQMPDVLVPVTAAVSAGWQADVVQTTAQEPAIGEAVPVITVEASLQPVSVKETLSATGFVAVEVAADVGLQESILAGAGDVDQQTLQEIASGAARKLSEDQARTAAQAQERQAAVEEAVSRLHREQPDAKEPVVPVFTPSGDDSRDSADDSDDDDPDEKPAPGPAEWTVTFRYQGGVYGTQTVTAGQPVQKPDLQPTSAGAWSLGGAPYDFASPVTANLTLVWAEA